MEAASARTLFAPLGPTYDRYASLLSLGQDPRWRRFLVSRIEAGPEHTVLDVATGSGAVAFELVRTKGCRVLGVDQSSAMLEIARKRCPGARFVLGDALELPFEDGSFDLVFSSHFYGHLRPKERARFLRQAGRVADSLVVVENALRPRLRRETVQRRALSDGSRHRIYKRFFTASDLAAELEAGVLFEGEWFVAAANGRATDLVT